MMPSRLDGFIADAMLVSRADAKKLIKNGLVSVNGHICRAPDTHVSETDDITSGGNRLTVRGAVVIMMNKPAGVVSASRDSREQTALSLLPENFRRMGLFIAGRLDKDTEGFLLITNDGALAHEITSPRHHRDKVYVVKTDAPFTEDDVSAFAEGVTISAGEICAPAKLELTGEGGGLISRLTIHEGKFHQVKRMAECRGRYVTHLKRIMIGGVALDPSLSPGDWRELTPEEEAVLRGK